MSVTRADVLAAYEAILQRPPESEAAYAMHLGAADRMALGRALMASPEFRARLPASSPMQHYSGYTAEDLAVLAAFPPGPRYGTPGFTTNFLGVRTRIAFVNAFAPQDGQVEPVPLPEGSGLAETVEWVATLRAVLEARRSFRLLELGAGYGPWMSNCAAACGHRGIADVRAYGVEADAGHLGFMTQHMQDNAIPPAQHVLLHGVVGATDGIARWAAHADPAAQYGGRPRRAEDPGQAAPLPMLGIAGLLGREPLWDLVHIDIQGDEGEVCQAGIEAMGRSVRRVVVGTHSRVQDGLVMAVFHAHGWVLEHEKPTQMRWRPGIASLEAMAWMDGTQAWRNPRLS